MRGCPRSSPAPRPSPSAVPHRGGARRASSRVSSRIRASTWRRCAGACGPSTVAWVRIPVLRAQGGSNALVPGNQRLRSYRAVHFPRFASHPRWGRIRLPSRHELRAPYGVSGGLRRNTMSNQEFVILGGARTRDDGVLGHVVGRQARPHDRVGTRARSPSRPPSSARVSPPPRSTTSSWGTRSRPTARRSTVPAMPR